MEQLVGEPTGNKNLLDLILSTEPSTIIDVTTFPGISDHEGVTFQFETYVYGKMHSITMDNSNPM